MYDAPPTSSVRYIYIIEGALTFHVRNQETIHAQKQDIVYIPDGCHYVSDWQEDSEIFVADIGILDLVTSERNYGNQARILFHDRKSALIEPVSRLKEICSYSEPYLWMECVSIIMHILCEIAREQEEKSRRSLILQSVVFLNANYEKDTPVERLAEMCSFSVSHYRRLFKEYYNMSPVEYRNRLRIRQAQQLLKDKSCTVARAAEAVGFDDPGYFTRLYKKYTGHAPRHTKTGQN